MRKLTREWIEKAEGDQAVAESQWLSPNPVYDAICFHAQQSAEKYLKAWLSEQQIAFPRTHDLEVLARLCIPSFGRLTRLIDRLRFLTSFAVEIRYPGTSSLRGDARRCLLTARQTRAMLRMRLGI